MSEKGTLHGQANLRINGNIYEIEDDAELIVGGIKRSHRMIGKKSCHSQTYVGSEVKCKTPLLSGMSLREMQELSSVEIIFESDIGTSWVIRNAVQTNTLSLKGGEGNGTLELVFEGEPAEEIS